MDQVSKEWLDTVLKMDSQLIRLDENNCPLEILTLEEVLLQYNLRPFKQIV